MGAHRLSLPTPRHDEETPLPGTKKTWPEIDNPDWRKEGDDIYDAIESFFDYLYFET